MKTIGIAFIVGLAAVTISPAWAAENEAAKKDLAALQGEWSMVSGSADGQPMPDEMLKQMKRICKGDETTTTMAGQLFIKAKITLDPSKKPKTIDYQMSSSGSTKWRETLSSHVSPNQAPSAPPTSPASQAMAARCPFGSARNQQRRPRRQNEISKAERMMIWPASRCHPSVACFSVRTRRRRRLRCGNPDCHPAARRTARPYPR